MARKDPPTNANPGDDGEEVTQVAAKQGGRPQTMVLVLLASIAIAVIAGIALLAGYWTV